MNKNSLFSSYRGPWENKPYCEDRSGSWCSELSEVIAPFLSMGHALSWLVASGVHVPRTVANAGGSQVAARSRARNSHQPMGRTSSGATRVSLLLTRTGPLGAWMLRKVSVQSCHERAYYTVSPLWGGWKEHGTTHAVWVSWMGGETRFWSIWFGMTSLGRLWIILQRGVVDCDVLLRDSDDTEGDSHQARVRRMPPYLRPRDIECGDIYVYNIALVVWR